MMMLELGLVVLEEAGGMLDCDRHGGKALGETECERDKDRGDGVEGGRRVGASDD